MAKRTAERTALLEIYEAWMEENIIVGAYCPS